LERRSIAVIHGEAVRLGQVRALWFDLSTVAEAMAMTLIMQHVEQSAHFGV
jgi:hypothetical protein